MKKKTMKRYLLSILALTGILFCATSLLAASYYVDAARPDNTGAGTSWSTAKRTIGGGIGLLSSGDTLKIKTGSYTNGIILAEKNWASETKIVTDDGNGNPGLVTVTGNISADDQDCIVYIHNTSNVTIDGRQLNGFTFVLRNNSHGLWGSGNAGTFGNIKILRSKFAGRSNEGGSDPSAIALYSFNDVEVGYCNIDVTGTAFGIQIASHDERYRSGGSVHDNDVKCETWGGEAAVDILRFNDLHVYGNFLHDIATWGDEINDIPGFIRCRGTEDAGQAGSKIYNNVIWVNKKQAFSAWQCRGASDGTGGSDNNEFYNNTIVLEAGYDPPSAIFHITDDSDGNRFYNNLVIGDVENLVDSWNDNIGRNNQLFNNVITGTVSTWFASGTSVMFDTNTENRAEQGTSFLSLSGNRPSPYWDLTASKDGSGSMPVFDFDGYPRSIPPDVGAFEFGLEKSLNGDWYTVELVSGVLKGAKIIYHKAEPVEPYFGPLNGIDSLDIANGIGLPLNLLPSTSFSNPVTIHIPCPGYDQVDELNIYYYDGTRWIFACNAAGEVQPEAQAWMVAGSRKNHNFSDVPINNDPSTIEIEVKGFSGAQAGFPSGSSGGGVVAGGEGGGEGGCFISAMQK